MGVRCHALSCRAPPGKRCIPQGLSNDRGTFTSAHSRLGSHSPKVKQALAEILAQLHHPLPDAGSSTEPCCLVWSRKRAESQQKHSCAAGGVQSSPCPCTPQGAQRGTRCPICLSFFRPLLLASSPSAGACTQLLLLSLQALHTQISERLSSSKNAVHQLSSWLSPNQQTFENKQRKTSCKHPKDAVVQDQDAPHSYLGTPNSLRILQPQLKPSISSSPTFGDSPA